jgi:hypothetical protein
MSEPITEESFIEWQGHPVTRRFMKLLETDREVMKEGMVSNNYSPDEQNRIKGTCEAIIQILKLSYSDLFPNYEGIHDPKP